MKKVLWILLLATVLSLMILPAMAEEISFTVFDETEMDYIYFQAGVQSSGKNAFYDCGSHVIYEFPLEEGATVAQFALAVGYQYQISVSVTDPDDPESYVVVAEASPSEEEVKNEVAAWGGPAESILVLDLSEYCQDNEYGLIWIKIGDVTPHTGWGAFINRNTPVRFYSGQGPAPEIEQPLSLQEQATLMLETYEFAEGTQYFAVNHTSEEPFIYHMGGAYDVSFGRFTDCQEYIIYKFDVKATDTMALLNLSLNNQYEIRATMGDPSELDDYTLIAQAFPTDEELEAGAPNWGYRIVTEEIVDETTGEVIGTNKIYPINTFDLSEVLTGKDGTMYVYIGDCAPVNGWGAYITFEIPVVFSTSGEFYTKGEVTAETEEETIPETEAETEPETEVETEAETEAETEVETEKEAESQAETEAETVAETEPETESATEPETEAEPETEVETEIETEKEIAESPDCIEPETVEETEAETEGQPAPETEAETTPETDSDAPAADRSTAVKAIAIGVIVVFTVGGITLARKKR